MMNYIWGGMLIIGIIFGVVTGNMQAVTDAVLQSSKEAVTLGISMLGIVAFWTGLMEVAGEAGVIAGLTRLISPFMRFLVPKDTQRPQGMGLPVRKLCGEHTRTRMGSDAGGALSYYNDRLKNPLRNQGFPPNLVLMKKCSFASKHF